MKRRIGKALNRWAKKSRRPDFAFLERHLEQLPAGAAILNIGSGGEYDDLVRRIAGERGFKVRSSDIDPERNPDLVDDICASGLPSDSLDAIIMFSVIEHVQQPFEAVREIGRILKPGGSALLLAPFLFPIHDRPNDYFRFTEYGLRLLFAQLEIQSIERRDNWLQAILLNAARIGYERGRAGHLAFLVVPVCILLSPLARLISPSGPDFITSGYLLKVVKPTGAR